jgi:hypothetical protein
LKRLGVHRKLIGRVVSLIRERAERVKVRSSKEISPDPEDEPFCLCGEQGKADFIVTLNPSDFPQEHLRAKCNIDLRLRGNAPPVNGDLLHRIHRGPLSTSGLERRWSMTGSSTMALAQLYLIGWGLSSFGYPTSLNA